jgi:hypothetical protein
MVWIVVGHCVLAGGSPTPQHGERPIFLCQNDADIWIADLPCRFVSESCWLSGIGPSHLHCVFGLVLDQCTSSYQIAAGAE